LHKNICEYRFLLQAKMVYDTVRDWSLSKHVDVYKMDSLVGESCSEDRKGHLSENCKKPGIFA
jgi:hypothetical protein